MKRRIKPNSQMWTESEAAQLLRCSTSHARHLRLTRQLGCYRGRPGLSQADLEVYVAAVKTSEFECPEQARGTPSYRRFGKLADPRDTVAFHSIRLPSQSQASTSAPTFNSLFRRAAASGSALGRSAVCFMRRLARWAVWTWAGSIGDYLAAEALRNAFPAAVWDSGSARSCIRPSQAVQSRWRRHAS